MVYTTIYKHTKEFFESASSHWALIRVEEGKEARRENKIQDDSETLKRGSNMKRSFRRRKEKINPFCNEIVSEVVGIRR